jgi:hypothetical protein
VAKAMPSIDAVARRRLGDPGQHRGRVELRRYRLREFAGFGAVGVGFRPPVSALSARCHEHVDTDIIALSHVGHRQRRQHQLHPRSITGPDRDLSIATLDVGDPAGNLMTYLPARGTGRFSDHYLLSPCCRDRGRRRRPLTRPAPRHTNRHCHYYTRSPHDTPASGNGVAEPSVRRRQNC